MSGRVFAPDGSPMRNAQVALLDPLGNSIAVALSDAEGRFRLTSVAPGVYHVRAEAASLRSPPHRLTVLHGLPLELDITLSPQLSESVAVSSDVWSGGGTSGTTLAGEAVRRTSARSRAGALRSAIAETAGWTSEDNGLMHYRGVDDGVLFVLDGVPVYERLDPQFGVGLDPLTLGSVRVLSGYIPPEFGLRSGGVIEVRSRAASADSWSGLVETGVASQRTQGLSGLMHGPIGRNASLSLSLAGEQSDRFLDAVSLDNLHNHGSSGSGESELAWRPGPSVMTLRAGHARSWFDVPHGEAQEATGQDQRQAIRQSFATFNWQRSWSQTTVSQLALFGRSTKGSLSGSPSDVPLVAEAARRQDRLGLVASVMREQARHRLKAGVEASRISLDESLHFFVTDPGEGEEAGLSQAALEHGRDDPFDFTADARRPVYSFYLQDSWRARDRLTIDAGVRYDRSRVLVGESQWSPRLGVSHRSGRATFRASLNRLFQPPQTEYLLLASSREARRLSPFAALDGEGGAEIRSERQTAVEAGCELWLGGALRADIAAWRRWIRNQGDPNVFFGTTILFPNSVDRGRAKGLDVRLELPRRAGIAGFVTYTLSKVDQFGPINGGLFLEDDVIEIGPGTKFTPDHDQRHALTGEISFEDRSGGFWVGLGGRYRSGTPLGVAEDEFSELAKRRGADLVDFERGRVKAYATLDLRGAKRLIRRRRFELTARASLLNLFNARYAFNFGNPFSGTHFGAPRGARLDLRLSLPRP